MKIPKQMMPYLEAYGKLWGYTAEEIAVQFISKGIVEMVNNETLRKTRESLALARKITRSKGGGA